MSIRAYAFPHAGGAAHNFGPLQSRLRSIDLRPQDYPGHGRRASEPLLHDLRAIAEDALGRLRPVLVPPYALLGHSMGARVAVLVTHLVEAEGLPPPQFVVVSGTPAPGHEDRTPIHELPDGEFLDELRQLGGLPEAIVAERELMDFLLPILRADLTAVETWAPAPWTLSVPIVGLHGRDDIHHRDAARAWRERTRSAFLLEELNGGHFFLYEATGSAAATIDRLAARVLNRF